MLRGVVREIKACSEGGDGASSPEKSADALCTLRPGEGLVSCCYTIYVAKET